MWRRLPIEKEMVLTSNGRPIAVITAVDEATLEESLAAWRRARATGAIAGIQQESVHKGTDQISMPEIEDEIRRSRADRRKQHT